MRGGNSAPKDEMYHEIVGTHGGALLREQNPSCVSALIPGLDRRQTFHELNLNHLDQLELINKFLEP